MADKGKKQSNTSTNPLFLMSAAEGLTLNPMSGSAILMPVPHSEATFIPTDAEEVDSFLGQSPPKQTNEPAHFKFFKQSQESSAIVDPFAQIGSLPMNVPTSRNTIPTMSTTTPFDNIPKFEPATDLDDSNFGPTTSGPPQNYRRQNTGNPIGPPPTIPYNQSPVTTPLPTYPPPSTTIPPVQSLVQPSISAQPYHPVDPHWFYSTEIEGKNIWVPMSFLDTLKLEEAFNTVMQNPDNQVVCTDGGRYDVNIIEGIRKSIYWEETPTIVRRCTWFYKGDRDKRYMPFEENVAMKLEMEYKNSVLTDNWHKKLELPNNESVVMHNPNVIVYFQPTCFLDEWAGLPESQIRPKVVKRGVEDMLDQISDGETVNIDHVCFVVHGIGPVCDLRFRSIVECVDDFRSISHSLLKSHFSKPVGERQINRVEYLPVYWHSALHGDATGVDRRLKAITLQSIPKLRHFTNDTLLDILFYTSPTYCQTIADTVALEINRLYNLFLSRNPYFKGAASIIGHSLGSLIIFDLLSHQNNLDSSQQTKDNLVLGHTPPPDNVEVPEDDFNQEDEIANKELTLVEMLANIGLGEYIDIFQKEKIDMETLIICSESDIKDLGLPMGPRKKLMVFLKEKTAQIEASKEKAKESAAIQKAISENAESQLAHTDSLSSRGSTASVHYTLGVTGTGQPVINYPKLDFAPTIFFAVGSPIGMFLTVRGIDMIGEEFSLPTCPGFFNIFHPFDPVAYRVEPMIVPNLNLKPVLMPHHKGRKRLHLELRESLTRVGADIKNRVLESIRSTWHSINEFARAHRYTQAQVEAEVDKVVEQMQHQNEEAESITTESPGEEEIPMGQLNGGNRIDYVLQEKPIESFNDYLFALQSHTCYWVSEDTALLVLKEIYRLMGITPQLQGVDDTQKFGKRQIGPPLYTNYQMPQPFANTNFIPNSQNMAMSYPPNVSPLAGPSPSSPPNLNMQHELGAALGPPPLSGFIRSIPRK